MNEIRKRILEVSRDLFIEQGYKKTTTRQIIQKADILNGSLYHFFENKEDIFKHIIVDVNEETITLAKEFAVKYSDSILIFAFPIALLLYAVEKQVRLAEVFLEAYSAWPILDIFTRRCADRMQEMYADYNPHFSEGDYYLKSLAIMGCTRGFIAESFFSGTSGYRDKLAIELKAFQMLFNMPAFDINETITKIANIFNNEEIIIYGIRV